MSLNKDFVAFIECLSRRNVEYLLVGGHALAFHCQPRFTKDIDFWIRPVPENAVRLMLALDDFGFGDVGLKSEDFCKLGRIVQLGMPPGRIDILTSIDGVDFDSAYHRRVKSTYEENALNVISREDLIANKRASGRDQDLLDLKILTKT